MSATPKISCAVFVLLTAVAGYGAIAGAPVTTGRPPPARPASEALVARITDVRGTRAPGDGSTPARRRARAPPPDTLRIHVSGSRLPDREALTARLRAHADEARDTEHPLLVSTRSVLVVAEKGTTWGPVRSVLQACSDPEVRIRRTWMTIEGRAPVRAFLYLDGPRGRRVERAEIGVELVESRPRNLVKLLDCCLGPGEQAFLELERRLARIEADAPELPGSFLASADVPFADVLRAFAALRRQGVEEVRFCRVPPPSWAEIRAEEHERKGRGPEAIGEWVNALGSDAHRRAAARLVEIGEPALPALLAALDSGRRTGRVGVLDALAEIVSPGSHEAIPVLIRELANWDTDDSAALVLVNMGRAAAPALVDALSSDRQTVPGAKHALRLMGEDAITALRWGLVRGETPRARKMALDLLREIGPPEEEFRERGGSQVDEEHPRAPRGE